MINCLFYKDQCCKHPTAPVSFYDDTPCIMLPKHQNLLDSRVRGNCNVKERKTIPVKVYNERAKLL